MSPNEDDLNFAVALIAARLTEDLDPSKVGDVRPTHTDSGVVFLLGAGCSRQYGLPRLQDLLTSLWEDAFEVPADSTLDIEHLRSRLTRYWEAQGQAARRNVLQRYLGHGQIGGQHCPGYRRLAEMAKLGRVRAFVNLNWDTLLEEALESQGVAFQLASSFQQNHRGSLVVYKPLGSIGGELPGMSELVLDIAHSDLLSDPREHSAAQTLLGQTDVVVIGYSGADARISTALMGAEGDRHSHAIFVINNRPIDPRLAFVAAERRSCGLVLQADFESFMERLHRSLFIEARPTKRLPGHSSRDTLNEEMPPTREEQAAIKSCLRLAYALQADSGVNDLTSEGIEAHGDNVFYRSVELARSCGIALSGPERFLLHAAGYLHDTACFSACETSGNNSRLESWRHHGHLTTGRIIKQLQRVPALRDQLTPSSYGKEDREAILELLLKLCELHDSLREVDNRFTAQMVRVNGIEVPLRLTILHALFSLADQIENSHPFLPSVDPLLPSGLPAWVLDGDSPYVHLNCSGNVLQFKIRNGHLLVNFSGSGEQALSARELWHVGIIGLFAKKLDAVSRLYGGRGIDLISSPAIEMPAKDRLAKTFSAALGDVVRGEAMVIETPFADYTPPTVFISYSWDNLEHRAWVRKFATRLQHDGISVSLDQWNLFPGDPLFLFMQHAIWHNDFVLIVCTPKYKHRADGRIGGVGREGDIMTVEMYTKRNDRKFIPLLRDGEAEQAMPEWLTGKYYLDFRSDPLDKVSYDTLLDVLLGRVPKAPPIGRPPLPQSDL